MKTYKCKWTHELLQEEALKYTTKNDFKTLSHSAYNTAHRIGILKDICGHMAGNGYTLEWTKEMCIERAKNCTTIVDFQKKYGRAYQVARTMNWLSDVEQSANLIRKNKQWTKESLHQVALNYHYRSDFQLGAKVPYSLARKYGYLDDICSHMAPRKRLSDETKLKMSQSHLGKKRTKKVICQEQQ